MQAEIAAEEERGGRPYMLTSRQPPAFGSGASATRHRRHLTESQRAMIAAKLANTGRGGMRDAERANLPNRDNEVSNADAAGLLNVSERSVKSARKVRDKGAKNVVDMVKAGELASRPSRKRNAALARATSFSMWQVAAGP